MFVKVFVILFSISTSVTVSFFNKKHICGTKLEKESIEQKKKRERKTYKTTLQSPRKFKV